MYIGCGRLSIIITEGQMRIFLMTPVGVVVTTRGRERVKDVIPGTGHKERNQGGGASARDGPILRLQPSITSPMVSEKSSK